MTCIIPDVSCASCSDCRALPNARRHISICRWTHYHDASGVEGIDSCFQLFTTTMSLPNAQSACVSLGAHLLTSSATAGNGIFQAVNNISPGQYYWIGCSQGPRATQKGSGWTWVDGTSASNLDCGNQQVRWDRSSPGRFVPGLALHHILVVQRLSVF